LTSIEIKYFKRTAGDIIFDHKSNKDVVEDLKVEQVDEKLRIYKPNLLHVTGINCSWMEK
jgi:hypothetical protein